MKKALNIIKSILVCSVVLFAVSMMVFTLVSSSMFNRSDRTLFGYRMYIVKTDSMSKTDFDAGDLIIVKRIDPSTLNEGDIITYFSQNRESYGETVTHKIRRRILDAEGSPGFITYGTTTGVDDETAVTYPYILGRYIGNIPGLGSFFHFLKTPGGYILCIFVPFALLILFEGIRCVRLFRCYKREHVSDLAVERAKLEGERAEYFKMMEELRGLKEQMMQKDQLTLKDQMTLKDPLTEQTTAEASSCTEEVLG